MTIAPATVNGRVMISTTGGTGSGAGGGTTTTLGSAAKADEIEDAIATASTRGTILLVTLISLNRNLSGLDRPDKG